MKHRYYPSLCEPKYVSVYSPDGRGTMMVPESMAQSSERIDIKPSFSKLEKILKLK